MKVHIQHNKLVLFALLIVASSCKLDNYPGPSQTIKGEVIDSLTGEPLQTELGSGGIRIELDELSWSSNPTPYYFYSKQNGTFRNTKIFKGKYRIDAQGAFVPLLQKDANGKIVVDHRKTVKTISDTTIISFTVTPFLSVKWIGKPIFNADSSVTIKVIITRGTQNSQFQQPVTDIGLFVNRYHFVGNNSFRDNLSTRLHFSGTSGNAELGKTITLTTAPLTQNGVKEWFLRVGARTNYGLKYYNYNKPIKITLN